jgi:hypothetical protein
VFVRGAPQLNGGRDHWAAACSGGGRKAPGEYRISDGSFIGEGGSREATPAMSPTSSAT